VQQRVNYENVGIFYCLKKLLYLSLILSFWQSYGQAPSCTALSLPANGTIDVPLDVDFEWVAAANTTKYFLTIATSSGGNDILDNFDVGNVTMFDLPVNLPAGSTIYVTIVTSNASGENTNCAEISFTTIATISALECSELLIPIKGAVDVPLNTILEWTASPGATGYRITIGSSSDNNDILDNFDVGNNTSYQLPGGFSELTSVFLNIYPYNDIGSNQTCSEMRFTTTSGQVPQCTQIINPQDGALLVPVNANMTWIRDFTATGYLMTIRKKEPDGAFILREENVGNGTNYKPPNFEPRTKYFITIIPYNTQGNAVGCQAIVIETGDPLPLPNCVNWVLPENGSKDIPQTTSLEWEAVTNADGYILTIGTSLNGTDLLDNEDVSTATSYDLAQDLPENTKIYVKINTYVGDVLSENCVIISFTTEGPDIPDITENIPKFFTPNNDGINDSWAVDSLNNINITSVSIFDRFGRLVEQLSPNQQWDGTFNGRDLPSDSYWYAVELENSSRVTGYFVLKR
jgi:gliding motility-associated-like protein